MEKTRDFSVFYGKDYELIPTLLNIHCESNNPLILDCTANTGKMWKNLKYKLIRMDINEEFKPDIVGDFNNIPFKDNMFDVLVFDPPHLPTNACSKNSSKIYEKSYGITNNSGVGRDGDNVSEMFKSFLQEAKRVLKNGGIILAKIADLIHNHRYQWQHVDFINYVKQENMTPCDMMIKSDPNAGHLKSSKWINVKHLRKNHCFWIVVRNSDKCESN